MKIKEWGWATYKRSLNAEGDTVVRKKKKYRSVVSQPPKVPPDRLRYKHADTQILDETCHSERSEAGLQVAHGVKIPRINETDVSAIIRHGNLSQINMSGIKGVPNTNKVVLDLHAAIAGGQFSEVTKLLSMDEVKQTIEKPNYHGDTVLHVAVQMQRVDLAELLIGQGANVDSKGAASKTALHHFFSSLTPWQTEIFEKLVKSTSRISERDDEGNTPLHTALIFGHLQTPRTQQFVLNLFLEHGDNPNFRNAARTTPFQMVIEDTLRCGRGVYWEDLIMTFLVHGADPNLEIDGTRILYKVFQMDDSLDSAYEVLKYLLLFGAVPVSTNLVHDVYERINHITEARGERNCNKKVKCISILKELLSMFVRGQYAANVHYKWSFWWNEYKAFRQRNFRTGDYSTWDFDQAKRLIDEAPFHAKDDLKGLPEMALSFAYEGLMRAESKPFRDLKDLDAVPTKELHAAVQDYHARMTRIIRDYDRLGLPKELGHHVYSALLSDDCRLISKHLKLHHGPSSPKTHLLKQPYDTFWVLGTIDLL